MIAGCAPVDCAETRQFIREMGIDPDTLPWMVPYKGSTRGKCHLYGGLVWIGPQQRQGIQTGMIDVVLCHICVAVISGGEMPEIMELSDETTPVISPKRSATSG